MKLSIAAVAVVAVVGLAVYGWRTSVERSTWERAVLLDGSTLELQYGAGSCEDWRRVSVDQDGETVRLTLRTLQVARGCDDMANPDSVEVDLGRPLDGRRLVDGACDPDPEHGGCTDAAAARKAVPLSPVDASR